MVFQLNSISFATLCTCNMLPNTATVNCGFASRLYGVHMESLDLITELHACKNLLNEIESF